MPKRLALVLTLALLVAACAGGGQPAATTTGGGASLPPAPTPRPQPVGPAQPRETLPPSQTALPSTMPPGAGVAYVDAAGLWASDEGQPGRALVKAADITEPLIAPDKAWVAYRRQVSGTAEIWAVKWDGSGAKRLLGESDLAQGGAAPGALPSRLRWLPRSHVLLVGTQTADGKAADDLWRVNVDTGEVRRVLAAGQGGYFVPSFDGARIALARSGQGGTGVVAIVTADGSDVQTKLEYTGAAADPARVPRPMWARDDSGFLVAVEGPSGATLYRIPLDGAAEAFGRLDGPVTDIVWSPDRRRVGFTRQATPSAVVIADANGANPLVYAPGRFVNWSPDSARFAYQDGAAIYVGTYDQPTREWGKVSAAWAPRWLTTRAVVYTTTAPGAPGDLVYRTLVGQPVTLVPAASLWFDMTPYPYPDS